MADISGFSLCIYKMHYSLNTLASLRKTFILNIVLIGLSNFNVYSTPIINVIDGVIQ